MPRVCIDEPLRSSDESVNDRASMLRMVDYNYPSDEESNSPRGKYIAHANICMNGNDEDVSDMSSDEVDNAPVQVSAVPVPHVTSTSPTDNHQPMVLDTIDDMYQGFEEALLLPQDFRKSQ